MSVDVIIDGAISHSSDVAIASDEPIVSFEFLDSPVATAGIIGWRGAALAEDGLIYHIPYQRDEILITDPAADQVTAGPSVSSFPRDSGNLWVDALALSDGRIIANPRSAHGHLVIDPSTDPATTRAVEAAGGPINYGMQTRGGAIVDGIIYSSTYDLTLGADTVVRTVRASTEIYDGNIFITNDRTGPYYQGRPNWASESYSIQTYWGAVEGGNGKVYCIPCGQERIGIIECSTTPANRVAYQGNDTLTGNADLPTGTDPIPDPANSPYLIKYSGGTRSSHNGCIYSMPRHARAVLKIDPADDSATEIPFPSNLMDFITENGLEDEGFSLGSVEGPDLRIYGTLWQASFILWIDPRTDRIGWIDMQPYLDDDATGITNNHYAYSVRVGDALYFSPGAANKVMKMNIR